MNMLLLVQIYCEIGGGMSADAFITAPHPEGLGAKNVMLNCLRDAGLKPTDVDGSTCTELQPLGDMAGSKAILHVFGEHAYTMNLNSTKSMTGHLLGAAGAVETILHSFDEIRNFQPSIILQMMKTLILN
jgi:3-oxoacyl-[acyl-carrier-protein] synthase II